MGDALQKPLVLPFMFRTFAPLKLGRHGVTTG